MQLITGFHAIEEKVRKASLSEKIEGLSLLLAKSGPRIKKILEIAKKSGIPVQNCDLKTLDEMVKSLPEVAREHRGLVLQIQGESTKAENDIDFDQWILENSKKDESEKSLVVVLDSVTDPHNVGAILRSCDQFGVNLVILPERNSANDFQHNEIIARSSAGASAYVPVSVVTNLVRTVQILKENGFWVYGADAGGTSVEKIDYANKTVLIMGSEGTGISQLLKEQCDSIASIPTCGKIDSLNVSVATGILLYDIYRRN